MQTRRIRIATVMIAVGVIALTIALVRREVEVRRLRAALQAAEAALAQTEQREMLSRYYAELARVTAIQKSATEPVTPAADKPDPE